MKENELCRNCRFFDKRKERVYFITPERLGNGGVCCRCCPHPEIVWGSRAIEDNMVARWPLVRETDACGYFEPEQSIAK